jgi:hypothetical protein
MFAYTVLMLAVAHLPPNYPAGAALLVPLIGLAGYYFSATVGGAA